VRNGSSARGSGIGGDGGGEGDDGGGEDGARGMDFISRRKYTTRNKPSGTEKEKEKRRQDAELQHVNTGAPAEPKTASGTGR
jgi:hypothetical protein